LKCRAREKERGGEAQKKERALLVFFRWRFVGHNESHTLTFLLFFPGPVLPLHIASPSQIWTSSHTDMRRCDIEF
jgi:hypothetical protein